jgi:hypothetical protein
MYGFGKTPDVVTWVLESSSFRLVDLSREWLLCFACQSSHARTFEKGFEGVKRCEVRSRGTVQTKQSQPLDGGE